MRTLADFGKIVSRESHEEAVLFSPQRKELLLSQLFDFGLGGTVVVWKVLLEMSQMSLKIDLLFFFSEIRNSSFR